MGKQHVYCEIVKLWAKLIFLLLCQFVWCCQMKQVTSARRSLYDFSNEEKVKISGTAMLLLQRMKNSPATSFLSKEGHRSVLLSWWALGRDFANRPEITDSKTKA